MNKEELDRHRRLLIEKVKELQQENKQLNSILTELEEWLKKNKIYQVLNLY